jgi:Ca-activated chloride channel family protein
VTLHSNFTRNPERLQRGLEMLRAEAGTSLYDALLLATEHLETREGRRVVVVITDGGDTTSYRSFHDALESLHRADSALYSIVVVPITNDAGRNVGGENALITLSGSTGGQVFFPAVGPALDSAFHDILTALRTQYLIGFYPRNLPPSTSRFRKIGINMKDANLRVFTRDGYYGK